MASKPFEHTKKMKIKAKKNVKVPVFFSAIKKEWLVRWRDNGIVALIAQLVIIMPMAIELLNSIYAAMNTKYLGTQMTVGFNLLIIMLPAYAVADFCNAFQIQLSCQHHHIGESGVKADCFKIGDIGLYRKVNAQSEVPCNGNDRHISGNDRIDARLFCRGAAVAHLLEFIIKYNGIESHPRFGAPGVTHLCNDWKILKGEIQSGAGAHIEFAHAEIDRMGSVCKSGRE